MKDIGEKLRQARIDKNITIDEASKVLKIRKTQLQYIEEGNIDAFPDTFYVKYFIREYANFLGLDAKEIFNEFENQVEHKEKPIDEPTKEVKVKKVNIKSDSKPTKRPKLKKSVKPYKIASSKYDNVASNLIIFIIIFALLFLIWYAFTSSSFGESLFKNPPTDTIQGDVDKEPEKENPKPDTDNENEKPNPGDEVAVTKQQIKFINKQDTNLFNYEVSNYEKIHLKLVWSGLSYVGVKDGIKNILDVTYDKGKTFESDINSKSLYINIGSFDFVEVYINDVLVPYQQHDANHYRIQINFK